MAQTIALYELEPIGVDGQLEAVACRWFCSVNCRDQFKAYAKGPVKDGFDDEWMDGTVCDWCENPLRRPIPDLGEVYERNIARVILGDRKK